MYGKELKELLVKVGDKQALVTTPTCALPIWTQSPWLAFSLPMSSRQTHFICGFSFLLIRFTLPIKAWVFVLSGTAKPITATKRYCGT